MAEEDGSPGGGAANPPPAAPPASTAAPEAPKYLTAEQLDEKLAAFQNGFFANARKAGLLKQEKPAESAPASPAPAQNKNADPMAVLALRDAFDDATAELKLTRGQRSLLRDHVMSRCTAGGEVESIVSDYVSRAGWNAPAPSATNTSAANPPPAAPAAPNATAAEAPKPAPAAAPSAPSGSNLPMSNGIVDIFAPGVARQLGPEGLRVELEKLWRIGEQQQGKPTRPKLPSQRK